MDKTVGELDMPRIRLLVLAVLMATALSTSANGPKSANAQQSTAALSKPQDWPVPGHYRDTSVVFNITRIDADGSVHGVHQGMDRGLWKAPDEFVARPGADGYPEYTVAGGTNQYLHLHSCGQDLCALFYRPNYGQRTERRMHRQ